MDIRANAVADPSSSGANPAARLQANAAQQLLLSMEEKPMMDEFVALYIGLQGNKNLEQKFRESLGVSC